MSKIEREPDEYPDCLYCEDSIDGMEDELVEGKWVRVPCARCHASLWDCENCGTVFSWKVYGHTCPHCGTDMLEDQR